MILTQEVLKLELMTFDQKKCEKKFHTAKNKNKCENYKKKIKFQKTSITIENVVLIQNRRITSFAVIKAHKNILLFSNCFLNFWQLNEI